jgi:hypothetical protein
MTEDEAKRLHCENAYLKDRCAQLESRVLQLSAQVAQLQEGATRSIRPHSRWHGNWLSTDQ